MRDMLRKCGAVWLLFTGFAVSIILIVSGIGYFVISRDYQRSKTEALHLREEYFAGQRQQIKNEVEEALDFIQYNRANTVKRLRKDLKVRTNEAFAIATSLYRVNQGRASDKEIRNMVVEALRSISFNHGLGYYFATGLDGVEILFADRPELEGQSMLNTRDTRGAYVIRDMVELVRLHGEGYYEYTWTKPNAQGVDFPKIAYVKYFAPFDGFIGTGEYLDDVEQDIQKEVLDRIGKIRFGKEGYVFVVNYDGTTLMNGTQPELIGKNMWEMTDPNGLKVIQEERRAADMAEGGFIEYLWEKPSTKEVRPKISFVKGFPQWRWMVGAGIYVDDIEPVIKAMDAAAGKVMRQDLRRLGFTLAAILSAAMLVCLLLSHYFKRQVDLFFHFFRVAQAGGKPIATEQIFLREFQLLGQLANGVFDERRKAEEGLRASEKKFRRAFLTSPDSINLNRFHDGMYLDINEGFTKIMGYSREEAIGKTSLELDIWDDPKDRERLVTTLEREGFVENMEARFRRKDGSIRIGLMSARVLRINREDVVLSITRDITERKRAEIALRESEELYHTLVSLSPDAYSVVDLNGLLTFTSARNLEMFGHSPDDDVLGRSILNWVVPEEQGKVFSNMMNLRTEGRLTATEYTLVKKDGTRFVGEVNAAVIHSPDGSPMRMMAIIRDITSRKQAEEEQKKLEERLQRAEKMEALGTLAGGVAHDLNNVLGIVVGYAELLQGDLEESSPARSKAREILKGGQRAATIVQDLLTLARRGVSNRTVLNLNNIVLECQNSPESANVLSYHANIGIKTDLEAHLLNVSGSAVHIGKALINLVTNAAEAMPDGGVITIKTENQYLDKPVSGYYEVRDGDYAVLSVSDTGEGIPSADLKRIFEPFYTKKVMGRSGTGLGLAVIWGTVKDHLGYINVESQEGKGTTFTLYFPVTREEISPEQLSLSIAEYMGNGESILIVDDVKEQRELAGAMLEKLNYSVVSVSGGEEAVTYLKQNAVDLVVLDMIMDPGMDGLDTYIKILGINPHQRAVIVSGFSETERVSRAQALGAGAYVKKPYVLEKLGLAVRKELDQPA